MFSAPALYVHKVQTAKLGKLMMQELEPVINVMILALIHALVHLKVNAQYALPERSWQEIAALIVVLKVVKLLDKFVKYVIPVLTEINQIQETLQF